MLLSMAYCLFISTHFCLFVCTYVCKIVLVVNIIFEMISSKQENQCEDMCIVSYQYLGLYTFSFCMYRFVPSSFTSISHFSFSLSSPFLPFPYFYLRSPLTPRFFCSMRVYVCASSHSFSRSHAFNNFSNNTTILLYPPS